jgi:hypothetical protein
VLITIPFPQACARQLRFVRETAMQFEKMIHTHTAAFRYVCSKRFGHVAEHLAFASASFVSLRLGRVRRALLSQRSLPGAACERRHTASRTRFGASQSDYL